MKHGVAFEDVTSLFDGHIPLLIDYDERKQYGEDRWIGVGMVRHQVIVVVFTESGPGIVRLISARKANHHERAKYFESIRD